MFPFFHPFTQSHSTGTGIAWCSRIMTCMTMVCMSEKLIASRHFYLWHSQYLVGKHSPHGAGTYGPQVVPKRDENFCSWCTKQKAVLQRMKKPDWKGQLIWRTYFSVQVPGFHSPPLPSFLKFFSLFRAETPICPDYLVWRTWARGLKSHGSLQKTPRPVSTSACDDRPGPVPVANKKPEPLMAEGIEKGEAKGFWRRRYWSLFK